MWKKARSSAGRGGYMGGSQDPRHEGEHPELKAAVRTPDLLLQPHHASLGMEFCTKARGFRPEYRGDIFAAPAWLLETAR